MGNPSNNQKIKIFSSKDPKVNKMENLDKTAYIKTYTLREIGGIDNNADECIVDMNNPIYSELDTDDIMTGNQPRIQRISIPEVIKTLEAFGYSPSLAREILDLWVLTDDKIKSIGRPLNLTKESNKSGTNLDDYFYFSLCNPPPMSLSSVHSHLKGHEDLIRQAHENHGSSIPKGLSNCMPLEPLVLEVYTQKIFAARKFTTIFVSTNGSLYHLYFSNEHGSDFPGSVISIYDDPGNEAQTNPHYSTYDNVDFIFRNRDIINQITIDFNLSFDFDWEFTVPNNRWFEYTSQHIPNYLRFRGLDTSKSGKNFEDFINMEIMFYNGQDVFELNVEYEIENAEGKIYRPLFSQRYIPKSRFRQMNAKLGILCAPTYIGCSSDDWNRTDGKISNHRGTFRDYPTKDAHDECNRRAFQNGDNMFCLQYDNQCFTSKMDEQEYWSTIRHSNSMYSWIHWNINETTEETNDNATRISKKCNLNKEDGHVAGGPWANACYRVQNEICYKYSKVCLKLDETYGFYLERTLAKNNEVERLIFWDIRKYRINPLTDLVNNPEWSNTPVRFPDGEIKQSEFISLGQVMLNAGSRKTMKVYIDQWGHWRILLSINPCPTKIGNSKSNIEELLREIRGQYDNREWTSMFSYTLDYGRDGSKINGSQYNPTYHDRFLKFYKKTPPNDTVVGSSSHDIVLRFNTDDTANPFKNKTIYYRLKPDELQKICGNFIHDEKAMMPPDLFNTGYKPIKTIKNNREDTCLSLCREEEKCDYAVLQGKVCHLYDKAANKYLINKDNKYVSPALSADHNVYRKVCMPSTARDQQNTEMGRAGFVIPSNNPDMNINMDLGKNFMILNNSNSSSNRIIDNFNKDLEKYRVDNLKPHEFKYNNLEKIISVIKPLIPVSIDLTKIGYKDNSTTSIKEFIHDCDYPTIHLARINDPDAEISNWYMDWYRKKIVPKVKDANTATISKVVDTNDKITSNTNITTKMNRTHDSMGIDKVEAFDNMDDNNTNKKIDDDTENLDKILREIQKMVYDPYYQNQNQNQTYNSIFTPEVISLSIVFICLLFILYRLHQRR